MSRFDESLRAVHSLACLRHLDADPQQVSVVIKPLRADCYPQEMQAQGRAPLATGEELADVCHWEAQVRLGPGKWGHNVGVGATPEEALANLLGGYMAAHNLVDARRAALMGRLGGAVPSDAANEKLLADLLGVLSQHCGERGGNEGALETLNRLVAESRVDGRAYTSGRSEGRADVAASLRSVLDPEDSNHWNLDGVLKEVQRLKDADRASRDGSKYT